MLYLIIWTHSCFMSEERTEVYSWFRHKSYLCLPGSNPCWKQCLWLLNIRRLYWLYNNFPCFLLSSEMCGFVKVNSLCFRPTSSHDVYYVQIGSAYLKFEGQHHCLLLLALTAWFLYTSAIAFYIVNYGDAFSFIDVFFLIGLTWEQSWAPSKSKGPCWLLLKDLSSMGFFFLWPTRYLWGSPQARYLSLVARRWCSAVSTRGSW